MYSTVIETRQQVLSKGFSPGHFLAPAGPIINSLLGWDVWVQAEYAVRVQLLEIYNEQLRDLLDCGRSGRRLDIRNTERSGLNVPEATQV